MPDTEPTTLSDFADDGADDTATGSEESPAQNAEDIQHLRTVVESLVDQIETITSDLEERDAEPGSESDAPAESTERQATAERMFQ
jgi:hypothetical protein